MNLILTLIALINTLLGLVARVLVSGIGLLVTALTVVLIAAAVGVGGVGGLGALRHFRRTKNSEEEKRTDRS